MRNTPGLFIGLVLIALGILFFLENLGYIDAGDVIADLWPLLIIGVGVHMLMRGRRSQPTVTVKDISPGHEKEERRSGGTEESGNVVAQSEVFGDIKLDIASKSFTGGTCTTVFGDIRLDLTRCELAQGEQYLRVSTVFGDVKLDIPKDMEFAVQVSSFIGEIKIKGEKHSGFVQSRSYQTSGYANANRKLSFVVSQVFGDTKIY
jgi:predicted membrane protein